MGADLKEFYITSVKEVDVEAGKKALVIFVPYRLHAKFLKISARLVRELEKKFAGKHVLFVAQRNVLTKAYAKFNPNVKRPASRTIAHVNEAILNDIVYPTQIVGKRTRVRLDGSHLLKVYLDAKDALSIDYKIKTFAAVYKKLTNKNVEFLFPQAD